MHSSHAEDKGRTGTAEALLGLLSIHPMSGYELRQLIEESIGNFWNESYGQIYPTLKRLERNGLVRMGEPSGKGRRPAKVYELTEKGREHLQGWLEIPAQRRVPRNELLLKLFFGDMGTTAQVRSQVQAFRDLHQRDLKRYEIKARSIASEYANVPAMPYWLMTLNFGRAESRAMLAWCDETLQACDAIDEQRRHQSSGEVASGPMELPRNEEHDAVG